VLAAVSDFPLLDFSLVESGFSAVESDLSVLEVVTDGFSEEADGLSLLSGLAAVSDFPLLDFSLSESVFASPSLLFLMKPGT